MPYGFRVAFVKIRRGSNMAIFTGAGVAKKMNLSIMTDWTN